MAISNISRSIKYRSAEVLFIILLMFAASSLLARPVGKFSYRGAPETINDSTIIVSDTMVAMAEKVYVRNSFYTDSIVDTPAICFVIDHSTSMSTAYGDTSRDPTGNRFLVTSALIDTVFKKFPTAEIGYVVFKNGLFYKYSDSTDVFGQYTAATVRNDGFMPLKKLNELYVNGTLRGIDVLKQFLLTRDSTVNSYAYKELLYKPSTWPTEGTNITLAFNAAKQVLTASTRQVATQYIIFMSDGEENAGGTGYEQGTGCPTTFTIYFTPSGTAPTRLVNMTNHIKANGFPRSAIWPFQVTNFDNLMSFVRDSIYSAILSSHPANPKSITIGTQTVNTWVPTDSSFSFESLFPLTGQITPFKYIITYPRAAGDTIHTVNFNVQTQGGLARNWRTPYEVKLWDRDIVFQTPEGVTVTTISRTLNTIQLRFDFTPGDANYTYTKASIELSNTNAAVRDREIMNLTKGAGNFFTGQINRVVASSATPSNNVLEHAAADTLIAVFRNTEPVKLPLDTLMTSIPLVISPNAVVLNAATKDNNGNGYIDAINITFDNDTSVLSTVTTGFFVKFGNVVLPVTGVERTPGGSARQWRLLIGEPAGAALETAALQTSWTPTLTLTDLARINSGTVHCVDSCPPVIYRVIKVITDANNRATDSVKVMFSEKIQGPNGTTFGVTNEPPNIFAVWWENTAVSADTLLNGIANFTSIVSDSILYFMMSNGKDLTARNWMNIETSSIAIRDKQGNATASNNRKVPVELQTISIIKTFPNPAVATKVQIDGKDVVVEVVKPGEKSQAKTIVLDQKRGGTIISIEGITIPPPNTGKVKLTMKVYDVAGNSVTWAKDEDLFSTSTLPGTSVFLFWNGFNQQKMKVAPGVYRAVVYVDYPPLSNIRDIKTISTVGIAQ